jgi:hypothetical protein
MDLTHLQGERHLKEVSEEAIEKGKGGSNLVFPQERGGETRFGDDVGELPQAHIDMNAGRVHDPFPLPTSSVWFDEEHFSGKAPRSRNVLFGVLTLPLEFFEVRGKLLREVAAYSRIADEGIDIRSHEVWGGHAVLLSLLADR